jgi:hypothetical protein
MEYFYFSSVSESDFIVADSWTEELLTMQNFRTFNYAKL